MPPEKQTQPIEKLASPGEAWRAAEAAGEDMALLEHKLSISPWERLVEHQRTLDILEMLEKAKYKPESNLSGTTPPMNTVQEIESAIRKLTLAEMRQVHDWLEDILEDKLELTDEFKARIEQSEKEMAAGLPPSFRL